MYEKYQIFMRNLIIQILLITKKSMLTKQSLRKHIISELRSNFCKINDNNDNDFHNQHVYKVYDKIAEHFSATPYKAWPKVANFVQNIKRGSIILDIGCGNGRNMGVNPAIEVIGVDRCLPLLNIAKERGQNRSLINADALRLPFKSESFDGAISIALIHHFASLEMRQKIIKQMGRVIKKKSKALIYVRSLQIINNRKQIVRELENQDFLDPYHLEQKQEKDLSKAVAEGQEQKNQIIYKRFYHAFVEGELEELVSSCNQFKINKSFYDRSNWGCIIQKT